MHLKLCTVFILFDLFIYYYYYFLIIMNVKLFYETVKSAI